ncbi:hypothetical protein PFISCL1PPCAC_27848, partial [Pristionchus fissidentatus]
CFTPMNVAFAIGTQLVENDLVYSCEPTEDGATLTNKIKVNGCSTGEYEPGEQFLSDNGLFMQVCTDSNGGHDFVGCMANGNVM